MSDAVVVEHLLKRFGETTALDGISATIGTGELFGFIGPDGAGKTTLFRILATLLVPDSGTATVLGRDVVRDLWALRQEIGYMPGRFSLYGDLSVEENLRFFASVFGTTLERERARIAPIYDQLAPFADRRAAALSGGMKQKLALCCALVHRPRILLLDEPTTGVDAVSRREFWDLLSTLGAEGLTIVVSTPYMDEATRCGRVALIQRGTLLAVDRPAAISQGFERRVFALRAPNRYALMQQVREYARTHLVYPFGTALHYMDERSAAAPEEIASALRGWLETQGVRDVVVEETPATIEDVFIDRMGTPEEAPTVHTT
jgi:ABC-type multidrug transport system ATPase subunit